MWPVVFICISLGYRVVAVRPLFMYYQWGSISCEKLHSFLDIRRSQTVGPVGR